jgi:hypothetical protein
MKNINALTDNLNWFDERNHSRLGCSGPSSGRRKQLRLGRAHYFVEIDRIKIGFFRKKHIISVIN